MILHRLAALAALSSLWIGLSASSTFAAGARRPNVVLILTDNQGAWTLGCYGNGEIRTPNIDRLAREGIRFTRCYSCNGVCSPTRATLLTGLMPSQHGVHCYLAAGGAQTGPEAYCTIREFGSLPKVLAGAGYTCGLSGKWHLGDNLHPQEGFAYWITMPHGSTTTFYGAQVIEDAQIRAEPTYLTDFWTQHGVRFIQQNKDRPFFLYLAYNGPYGLGKSLLEPARNRHAAYYADKMLECFPRQTPHPWLLNNRQYINNLQAMRRYAAEISGIDDGVGRILETLARLGLDQNTLVIFTADQGHSGGQNGIWGMGDHTRPLTTFDSEIHVPLLYRHPAGIPAGAQSDLMVSTYDMLPTLLGYLDLAEKIPGRPRGPGRDCSPVLRGKAVDWEQAVFYEFETARMIRTARWKYTRRFPHGPNELYDLQNDPQEQVNLCGRPDSAAIEEQLGKRLAAFFERYADPQYDLWRGGRSKSHLLTLPGQGPPLKDPLGRRLP